jgi:hypothetical protein
MDSYTGALEDNTEAMKVHSGAVESPPGAIKAEKALRYTCKKCL